MNVFAGVIAVPGGVEAVIWDVDGTLVTRSSDDRELVLQALAAAGIPPARLRPESVQRAQAFYRQTFLRWRTPEEEREGYRVIAGLLLEGTGASAEAVDRAAGVFAGYFDAYRVIPGMRELLADLAGRGLRQGVVSNWAPSLRAFLRHHRLDGCFAVIVNSAEEGVVKPDPTLFRRALERLGVPPQAAVYVGNDPVADIAPARALGMRAIHFDPRRDHPAADARDAGELRRLLWRLLTGRE